MKRREWQINPAACLKRLSQRDLSFESNKRYIVNLRDNRPYKVMIQPVALQALQLRSHLRGTFGVKRATNVVKVINGVGHLEILTEQQ